MCMTLGKESFKQKRRVAMEERKERFLKSSNSVITTAPDILEALKRTTMINGKA